MTEKLKAIPRNWKCLPMEVYSNIDREILKGVVEKLEEGQCYAAHVAQNFYGLVWKQGEKWYEAIKKNRAHVATLEADSLESILKEANARFES